MAITLRRRQASTFERAADGSMTLVEHFRELRNRLFWASVAIMAGFGVGVWLSEPVLTLLQDPYCDLPQGKIPGTDQCNFVQLGAPDLLLLKLKVSLWVGLIAAAPVWLYQLWAFIAPGLHRNERRYAYLFTAIAAPLFLAGAALAYFVVAKGLAFLLSFAGESVTTTLEITRYIGFVTNMLLIFGVAFEFPLVALMLNVVGIASGKRLLSWWRVVVFLFFAFSAVVTPTPDPFGMTALALCLSLLYFGAVGLAFLNDRRRGRGKEIYAGLDDDELSPLDLDESPAVAAGDRVDVPAPAVAPLPLARRYDDTT